MNDTAFLSLQRENYQQEVLALRQNFERTGDGSAMVRRHAASVDALFKAVWKHSLGRDGDRPGVAVVATGGYGRRQLFPYSDLDLLYIFANEDAERDFREAVRGCNQMLWDIGLRASPAMRKLKECERADPENLEFIVAALDRRFLAADNSLYRRFHADVLPALLLREWSGITQRLAEMARTRHAKYSNTIFHLEPNIKECPGGLRDYQLAKWLLLLRHLQEQQSWPKESAAAPTHGAMDAESAFDFLAATRCFLHFRRNRDDNTLDWHAQDEAAALSVGLETRGSADPAYWMRTYYRHARSVFRRASLMLDGLPPPRQSFYKQVRRRRAPVVGTDFFLEQGRIDLDETASLHDADSILKVFALVAAHGYSLTQSAEDRIAESLPVLAVHMPEGPFLWNCLREILLGPHSAHALRTMHALGVLELLIPEFHGIDALVIRDSYHRYTVDEHTFLAIDNIHQLRQPRSEGDQRFAALLPQIDRLDLFLLALLLHDTGKARRHGDHCAASVELAESLLARLDFDPEERETVRALIRNHLNMSLIMRRDIFDADNVRAFAESVATPLNLKMLALLTYADIKAVHPDALTPWKADALWQLYISTSNFLDRSVDEIRYHVGADTGLLNRILALVPDRKEELRSFLEGLPQRYLQSRLPEQIRKHFQMALELKLSPGESNPVQLAFRTARQLCELTLVTMDRPLLFADMAGALSAWGMNIVKADAFSNQAGLIVDTFQFTDNFRTLELNQSEIARFEESIAEVIALKTPLESLLRRRSHAFQRKPAKVNVATRLEFDNESSSISTLLQVVAPDYPGLLREVATTFAEQGCNIEVALIDTEGEIAIDVFYLTAQGRKLDPARQARLHEALSLALKASRPDEPDEPSSGSRETPPSASNLVSPCVPGNAASIHTA
jgi:[protein-PII] uridylyltransferase